MENRGAVYSDPGRRGYRPDIDGLRAVAVLLVVAFHAAPALVPGGLIGVDVFFVISGYLIAGLVWVELDERRFSFLRFYARRCRRIVPALAVVLAAIWALGWMAMFAEEFENLGMHVIGGAAFVANMVLATETSYFDPGAQTQPLLHLWSLGIEEQFYLVWPLLAALALRRRYPVAVLLAALGAASLGLYVFAWSANPVLTFYALPTRFWEILAGAGLAYYERSRGALRLGEAPPLVAGGALLAVAFGFGHAVLPARLLPLVAVAAALVLIASGRGARLGGLLSRRPVVFVGLISYPLYLWHWPLLAFARLAEGDALTRGNVAAVLAAAFVLATLTWLLIERPLRARVFPVERSRPAAVACLLSGASALAVLAALGAVTLAKNGFAGRLPQDGSAHVGSGSYIDAACLETGRFEGAFFCRRSERPLSVAVVGDSHANHLMPGLIEVLAEDGVGAIHVGDGGCPGLPGVQALSPYGNRLCGAATRAYVEFILSNAQIRTVLIATRVSLYGDPASGYRLQEEGGEAPAADTRAANVALLQRGYESLIARLQAAGKRVILVTEVPRLQFHPRECIGGRPFRLNPGAIRQPCTQSADPALVEASVRLARALAAAHPGAVVFDPSAVLCRAGECAAVADGHLLYRDHDHLSVEGSRRIAEQLRWLLQPSAAIATRLR